LPATDYEFVLALKEAVQRYLRAVDAWEAGFQKYYRMPGYTGRVSEDLLEEQAEYLEAHRRLELLAPRARGLCFKHGLRDPFPGLLKAPLGQHTPQQRRTSAISRSERSSVAECLMQLSVACQEWSETSAEPAASAGEEAGSEAPRPQSWLRRMVDFLY
jgi:hypothetical protein